MKKYLVSIACLIVCGLIFSCDSSSSDKNDSESGVKTISGTIVNWSDFLGAHVDYSASSGLYVQAVVMIEESEEETPAKKEKYMPTIETAVSTKGVIGSDGSFSITLNESVANTYLNEATTANWTLDNGDALTVSPSSGVYTSQALNAPKEIEVALFDSDGNVLYEIEYCYGTNNSEGEGELMYSTGAVKVSGKSSWLEEDEDDSIVRIDLDLNCSIPTGWSMMVSKATESTTEGTLDEIAYTKTDDLVVTSSSNLTVDNCKWNIEYDKD